MVYGPIAAYLVEAFPAKIRYTALSLPYHIGNGVFGGLLPVIGLSVVAPHRQHLRRPVLPDRRRRRSRSSSGSLLLKETHREKIWKEVQ